MRDTKNEAQGKWHGILSQFIEPEYLTGKHTKCPLCGGKDRFRFDNKDGGGSYYCNSCGAGTGIHLLSQHQGIEYPDAWRLVESCIGIVQIEKPKSVDGAARVKAIIDSCKEGGEFVKQYLSSRGILNAPKTLLEGLYYLDGVRCQAMIAKAAKGSRLAGLHATFIKDGKKIGRRMYAVERGAMVGSAIRLHKLNGGSEVVIGEGIETTLSASQITGMPAWAAMDAGKMEAIIIPEQIRRVVIAADNDESFTGQASAYALAKRLKFEGKSVEIMMPPRIGDWNDYIQQSKN